MPTPYGTDIAQAYQQVWPELQQPLAGTTAPEWGWDLRTALVSALPPRPTVVDTAVNQAANN